MKQVLFLLAVVLAFGCKKQGYNPNEMARLTPTEKKVVGKWKLERRLPDSEGKDVKEMVEVFDSIGGPVTMECLPNKTYTLIAMQIPVTGTWSVEGVNVRLRIEKVGDQRPEQIERIHNQTRGVNGFDMSALQREDFLKAHANSAALDQAEAVNNLQIGVDGKSLYVTRTNNGGNSLADILFSDVISVFKPAAEK